MSDSSAPEPATTAASAATGDVSNSQIMEFLTRFVSQQQTINMDLRNRQDQVLTFLEGMPTGTANNDALPAAVSEEVKDTSKQTEDDEDRKRQQVRNSRKSVTLLNSNNSTMYTGDLLSPTELPPPRVQTEAEKDRRTTRLFSSPTPPPKTPAPTIRPKLSSSLPPVDKSRHSKYYEANIAISKMDKFYGDRKNDKDIDVYTFVRSVDFQLERWMQGETFGRLELVISCTGGAAQMWLLNKRDDLSTLFSLGHITAEMTEWEYVRGDFIDNMGGGQVKRLHQTKLDGLKLGRGGDSEELAKFISKFHEWALRAYPLDDYPDTGTRSLMLGKVFENRVRDSDWGIWGQMIRTAPNTDKLEDLEMALQKVWTIEQHIRSAKSRKAGEYGPGGAKGTNRGFYPNSSSPSQSLQNMDVGSETGVESRGEEETNESLNVAAAAKKTPNASGGQRRANNKHIDGKTPAQLIRLNRCLHCYQSNHYARDCPAPANRPPKDSELKAPAGQQ